MGPPGLPRPSSKTLDRTARLLFGEDAPSIGTTRSRHSPSASQQAQGSKRKGKEVAGGSGSSSEAETVPAPSEEHDPSDAVGGGSGMNDSGSGSDIGTPQEGHASGSTSAGTAAGNDASDVIVIDQENSPPAKRTKKCTSDVWHYFTKKDEIVEIDGRKYIQTWGHCNFPKCRAKYRAEGSQGTTGFRNHLKSAHRIVKGQLQLKTERDHGKDITAVQPFKYDQEVSLKKLYIAIIMHEYPFNIVEHDYFVDFIKSLRPNFPIKSRTTVASRRGFGELAAAASLRFTCTTAQQRRRAPRVPERLVRCAARHALRVGTRVFRVPASACRAPVLCSTALQRSLGPGLWRTFGPFPVLEMFWAVWGLRWLAKRNRTERTGGLSQSWLSMDLSVSWSVSLVGYIPAGLHYLSFGKICYRALYNCVICSRTLFNCVFANNHYLDMVICY